MNIVDSYKHRIDIAEEICKDHYSRSRDLNYKDKELIAVLLNEVNKQLNERFYRDYVEGNASYSQIKKILLGLISGIIGPAIISIDDDKITSEKLLDEMDTMLDVMRKELHIEKDALIE